jgi:8-oxo-dGTP diphosphatase
MEKQTVRVGVGVVVLDGDRVLLIKRGKPPREGHWSLPGGHMEIGESVKAAAQREVEEETGLSVIVRGLVDVVDMIVPAANGDIEQQYVLIDYWAEPVSGELRAGSDAADARWYAIDDIGTLGMWTETERIIRQAVQLLDTHLG